MDKVFLTFKDGTLFSTGYSCLVHGKRGSFYELTLDQINVQLTSHFNQVLPTKITEQEPIYYFWLQPDGRTEKIYWQCQKVKYADYKPGYYYISEDLVTLCGITRDGKYILIGNIWEVDKDGYVVSSFRYETINFSK